MGRRLLIVTLAVVLAGAFGCGGGGGSDYVKKAPAAKPFDLGLPEDYAMGATFREPNQYVVKTQVENETRMMVLEAKVPGDNTWSVKWDDEAQMFYDNTKNHRYTITGDALHKITRQGLKEGQPGVPLFRFKISFDKKSGHVMLENTKIKVDNRENKSKGAWIVVQ